MITYRERLNIINMNKFIKPIIFITESIVVFWITYAITQKINPSLDYINNLIVSFCVLVLISYSRKKYNKSISDLEKLNSELSDKIDKIDVSHEKQTEEFSKQMSALSTLVKLDYKLIQSLENNIVHKYNILETDKRRIFTDLLIKSIDKSDIIPRVSWDVYNIYLNKISKECSSLIGIKRVTLSEFLYPSIPKTSQVCLEERTVTLEYLDELNSLDMDEKIRFFIVPDESEKNMMLQTSRDYKIKVNMHDPSIGNNSNEEEIEILKTYWEETGKNVDSYWITESKFKRLFDKPSEVEIPEDSAVYDKEILISYDNENNNNSVGLLTFKRLGKDDMKANSILKLHSLTQNCNSRKTALHKITYAKQLIEND